jgi:lysozyme family protein
MEGYGVTDFTRQKSVEFSRWKSCHVTPSLVTYIDGISHRLVAAKPRYQTVEAVTGIPWAIIAVIHERESSQSWFASLAQGDPWNKVSIHEPRGRGPFTSWEAAAIDALQDCPPRAAHWDDWSIGGSLCLLEQYNGEGYWNLGLPSPYLWSFTDRYSHGKYTADGHFDPNAVDHQIGCAALLQRMTAIDPTIAQDWHP